MAWWNASWSYRKKLTFGNADQGELTDFPVLVKLTTDNFTFANAKSAGADIRFVDADDTTELKYEIESWTDDTEAWIWVKVPTITASSATDFIYMYYGNSEASDAQDAANTWDSHYKAVYHLNKSSGVVVDSKGVNNGTNNGATRGQTGKIDNCFSFDGQDDYVNCGNDASLQIKKTLTVEGWIKRDVKDDRNTIASKLRFQDNKRCWFFLLRDDANNNKLDFYVSKDGVGNNYLRSNTGITDTVNWHYVVATYQYITDGTSVIKIYLDGNPDGSKNDVLGDLYAENGEPVRIGTMIDAAGAAYLHHDGLLDEARISDSVRSADWIKAQYLSMTLAFITFGGEDTSKILTENLGLVDTYSRTWAAYRVHSEILGLSDTVVKAPALMKTESLGLADTVIATRLLIKVLTELLGLSDTVRKDTSVIKGELLGLADTLTKDMTLHPLSEILGLLDTVTKSASIIKAESLGLEDRVSKHISLHALTEVLGLLDSISYGKNLTVMAKLIRKLIQLESIGGGGQN